MKTNERDIVYENGNAWVYADRKHARYTVFIAGVVASHSDSAYPLTNDGLSIAKARVDWLASRPRK